jgi:hypothetical protein
VFSPPLGIALKERDHASEQKALGAVICGTGGNISVRASDALTSENFCYSGMIQTVKMRNHSGCDLLCNKYLPNNAQYDLIGAEFNGDANDGFAKPQIPPVDLKLLLIA